MLKVDKFYFYLREFNTVFNLDLDFNRVRVQNNRVRVGTLERSIVCSYTNVQNMQIVK